MHSIVQFPYVLSLSSEGCSIHVVRPGSVGPKQIRLAAIASEPASKSLFEIFRAFAHHSYVEHIVSSAASANTPLFDKIMDPMSARVQDDENISIENV
jgi:hypothetical protein